MKNLHNATLGYSDSDIFNMDELGFFTLNNSMNDSVSKAKEIISMREVEESDDLAPECSLADALHSANLLKQFALLNSAILPQDFCEKLENLRIDVAYSRVKSSVQRKIIDFFKKKVINSNL